MTIKISDSETSPGWFKLKTGSTRDRALLRNEFTQHHHVRLPGLLNSELVGRIQRSLRETKFTFRTHEVGTELYAKDCKAHALLYLLFNDPDLFEVVREVTDCQRIGHFVGRVSRIGPEHEDSWHNDLEHGRMAAISVNLSEDRYSGGVLEIHDSQSGETVRTPNPVPGDAILFRLAPTLMHRITRVDGGTARTAWAGWFVHGDDSPLVRPIRTTR